MRRREAWLGARGGGNSERPRAHRISGDLYNHAVSEIAAGRIVPLRRAYCEDRPDLEDLTRAIVKKADILKLVVQRGDSGSLIDQLVTKTTAGTVGAETRCLSWLRGLAQSDNGESLSKQPKQNWRAQAMALSDLKGLSGRAFDRAWANVAREYPRMSAAGAKQRKDSA
jgi:hypothetical protein